jgi:hypothetical protein
MPNFHGRRCGVDHTGRAYPSPQRWLGSAGGGGVGHGVRGDGGASIIGIKPADPQRAGMSRAHGAALPVDGGAGGATIRRDVADRQRLATVFGVGFDDGHGRRLGRMSAGRQG